MKLIKHEIIDGKPVITTESKFLCFKSIRKFKAIEKGLDRWKWVELPDEKVIKFGLEIQLNAWHKIHKGK